MILSRLLMLGANYRLATFVFLGALTFLSGLGLPRLRLDSGLEILIPEDTPERQNYNRIRREFGSDNRIMIYVKDSQLWSPPKLAALEELHLALEKLRFVESVDDLFTLRTIRGVEGKIETHPVLLGGTRDQTAINQAREDALRDPLLVGNYLSRDGTVTVLAVSVREELEDPDFARQVKETLDLALSQPRAVFQEVFQLGPPRISADLRALLLRDLKVLGPSSALMLVLAIVFFLRSFFTPWLSLVTAGLCLVWTFGVMGWAGIPINILFAMLPSLVVLVGSGEHVHMFASYFRGVSLAQEQHRTFATHFMIKHLGVGLILAILTIALGFASNLVNSIGLIRDFALASTVAILSSGLITLLLIPMVLSAMGPRRTKLFPDSEQVSGLPGRFARLFGLGKPGFQKVLLLLTALLCAFFVHQFSRLYVSNDPLSYFKQDHPLIRDTFRFRQHLAGAQVFFITLGSDTDKAFQEPKNLEKLFTIQSFLEKQGVFDRSTSLADHLALVNRELHDGDPDFFKMPERRELVAQYLLFFHRRDLERYVSHDLRRANIVVRHSIGDSKKLNRYLQELKEMLPSVARGEITAYVVGENLMVNAAAQTLLTDQFISLGILLCVIFLIMSAMFTSFTGGFISLMPNLIPVVLMYGLLGVLGVPLNPATSMVAVITISIAINGTIHLISRYNELCRRTSNYEEAMRTTVQEEATPLVATYVALAVGFGILLLSGFALLAQFGALAAATMIFALFSNILITPIIMSKTRLVGLHQIWSLSVHHEILQKSPLFRGLSNYQMRKAILISELNEFKEGELLVKQGTFGRNMFLILTGQVEVVRRISGSTQRIAFLGAGQVFGEVGYVNEIERTADVRALTPVEALRFDYRKLKKDLKFFPHLVANMNFNISCILGERLAQTMGAMTLHEEEERFLHPDSTGGGEDLV